MIFSRLCRAQFPARVLSQSSTIVLTKANMSTIPPPKILTEQPNIPDKQLFGPGPSNMPDEIRSSMNAPLLGHLHGEFTKIMDDVREGIKYLFQTNNRLTFAISGTGHAGMEVAVMNLLEPGESFLVVKNGIWGLRAANLGKRLSLDVHVLEVPEGQVATLDQFTAAVKEHKPKVVFICQGESSTGVAHPLEGYADVAHANGALLLVDTVASIGGAPFEQDKLGVDVVYTATQKVLNAPPGLAPISFSAKAEEKIRSRKTPVVSFYFDALELGNYWGCFDEPRRYHHTGMVSMVYSLRAALAAIAKEGVEKEIARHQENAIFFYKELQNAGFEPFVANKSIRLPCLTTVKVPEGVDWKIVADKLMAQKIEIAGGLGPTLGKIWRIGTFGVNSNQDKIKKVVAALKEATEQAKAKI
uniref:Alanine--glyoxylate aminotransferase n=1 Tax=Panagrellus redivivus TaxID=6233 RepID=A0A7E4WAM1_PANRE